MERVQVAQPGGRLTGWVGRTRSFLVAAIVVVPMVFLAGLFGLAATGFGLVAPLGRWRRPN